jgi:hypothetical protein
LGRRKHTRGDIIETLKNLAGSLGKETLSKKEVSTVLPPSVVNYHFGSLGQALEAAGLKVLDPAEHFRDRGPTLSEDDLFASLSKVEHQVGREPTLNEYNAEGAYSTKPFRDRFGRWDEVLVHYRKWKVGPSTGGMVQPGTPVKGGQSTLLRASQAGKEGEHTAVGPLTSERRPSRVYGEPIEFRGLRHAPTNEQGVVYLFGMVSRELGFTVEAIQNAFPDCEGKRILDRKRNLWAGARIEFEFLASNFCEHGHDASQCDYIVCWENDWPDCPVTVIELRREILRLPSR